MNAGMTRLLALLAEPRTTDVLSVLNQGGEETRVVGGAIRNSLLGLAVADIDLATTCVPAQVMDLAQAAGFRVVPTGLAHGTITIFHQEAVFEVTTLREDIDTDGRHAQVRFGRDFAADAQRRDFTINGLSLSRDGMVHDTVGGLADLAQRRVRFIGKPAQRIAEDYLRILRFFRFHAAYGAGRLEQAGFAAAIEARAGLAYLSSERVQAELWKFLLTERACEIAVEIADAGLFAQSFRGQAFPARLQRFVLRNGGRADDAIMRLAALAMLVEEDADRLRDALRLSSADHRRLQTAARVVAFLRGGPLPPDNSSLGALVLRFGLQGASDGLALAYADAADGEHVQWQRSFQLLANFADLRLPITGNDLLQRGFSQGHRIGAALKTLQARWIRAGFPKDPAVLAQLIDEVVLEKNNALERAPDYQPAMRLQDAPAGPKA